MEKEKNGEKEQCRERWKEGKMEKQNSAEMDRMERNGEKEQCRERWNELKTGVKQQSRERWKEGEKLEKKNNTERDGKKGKK